MAHSFDVAFSGKKPSDIWAKARAAKLSGPSAQARAQAGSGRPHDDFPVAYATFAASLKGTPDEVWTKHFRSTHGALKMTYPAWQAALTAVKSA